MKNRRFSSLLRRTVALPLLFSALSMPAWAALTVTPITWNVIGLDSNAPAVGPYQFPVGARVCAVGTASNGPVTSSFQFIPFTPLPSGSSNGDTGCSGGACITSRAGTLVSLNLGSIPAGTCQDAYFEVEVARVAAAFGTARRFIISADDADPGTTTTPQPRELFVERLISQNRNSVLNVSYSAPLALNAAFPTAPGSLTSVNSGGSFGLAVGNFYDIRLDASTATQGYEQIQTFANFSNAVFRIRRVQSTYSADTSPNVASPSSLLYGDSCIWQLSPALPNYLGCLGSGKAGGTIATTYRIEILQVPGGSTSALNTLVYDYSGSSFHYNADTSSGGRTIFVESPASATIAKSFGPSTITAGGTSTLTFTISNPNRFSAVTLASFTDTLPTSPGQMSVANPQNVTYTGCGPGVFSPNPPLAGAISLSFSGATIQPQSDCVISIDVTATAQGTYNNTSSFLAINAVPTTSQATASLVVGPVSAPAICAPGAPRIEIARWNFSALVPPAAPVHPFAPSFLINGVTTSTAFRARTANAGPPIYGAGGQSSNAIGNLATSWSSTGWPASDLEVGATIPAAITSSLLEFDVETTAYSNIAITVDGMALGNGDWASPANNNGRFYHRFNDTGLYTASLPGLLNFPKSNSAAFITHAWTTIGVGDVNFQFAIGGGNKDTAVFLIDNVVVTGCNQFISQPTLTKSFATDPIVVGTNSRLSFVITNPNATQALTGVTFTDALPAGLQVAPTPNTSFSAGCAVGTAFTGIAAGATTLTFNGGVTAAGTCTAQVNIRGTTAGLKSNISSAIFTNETQTNTGPSGYGEDTLLVYADSLSKLFSPSPIVANGISTLTFVVTNPSATSPLTSVGFVDNFPTGLVVATTPNLTRSPATCGTVGPGGNWNNTGGAQVTLTGVTVAAAASCTYTVDVTSAAAATYPNLSNALTFQVNGAGPVITGDTAAATLIVNAPISTIGLRKQIAITNTPTTVWSDFISIAPATPVFYKFTVENTGTAVLLRPGTGFWVVDALIPGGPFCNTPATLPVAVQANDDHIFECIVGPVVTPGTATTLTNSATASSTLATSAADRATYTSKLPDLFVTKTRVLPAAAFIEIGVVNFITYRITVQNLGPSTTVNDTLAPIFVEDTLRAGITYLSFTASNPAWNCVQTQVSLDKVVCTFNDALPAGTSTSFDLNVRVAVNTPDINNTAVALNGGDPACTDPAPLPDTDCKGPFIEVTVPVTLSDVFARVQDGELVVDFGTAAETGTLGFHVLTENRIGALPKTLGTELTLALDKPFVAQRYQIRGPYRGETLIWIEEWAINGERTRYGPFAVGQKSGDANLSVLTDWSAIASEQRTFRTAQARAMSNRATGSVQAELKVASTGWARVSFEELLAQNIDWSGRPSNQISLHQGSQAVPLQYAGPELVGPGSSFSFFGQAVSGSQYTTTSSYSLRSGTARLDLPASFAGPGLLTPQRTAVDRFEHAPNRGYFLASPAESPWWARRLVRSNVASASVSENFTLPEKASGSADESMEVVLWGGLDFPTGPDHSVRLHLNGTVIASRRWDGVTVETVSIRLPAGLLLSGNNTLTLELVGDTGLNADVVYLDAIHVSYQRALRAVGNRIEFSGVLAAEPAVEESSLFGDDFSREGMSACSAREPRCVAYSVNGLTTPEVQVIRQREDGSIERLAHTRSTQEAGTYSLSFAAVERDGDRYFVSPRAGRTVAAISPVAELQHPLAAISGSAQLLILSHPSFLQNLAPLIAARRAEGLSVGVLNVEEVYRYFNRGVVDPFAISAVIAEAQRTLGTRYVLLVGGDTYDYLNYLGANSMSFLPTYYRSTNRFVNFAPVDAPYGDVDQDGLADVAIGRFPVRNNAELDALIAKTLAYPNAGHDGRYLRISDRDQGSFNFDGQSQSLGNMLGSRWTQSAVSLRSFATGSNGVLEARADLVAAVNSGQALVSYFGHSSLSNWTRESLLTAPLVYAGLFSNAGAPTMVWNLGCYGAYFVEPSQNTIAHGLMLQANSGGAAVVIGATGLTEVSSDLAWMAALAPRLSQQRIGDAFVASQRQLAQDGYPLRDVSLGAVLLGDPTLRVQIRQ